MKSVDRKCQSVSPRAEIVYRSTGRGLAEDARLLSQLLEMHGYAVYQRELPAQGVFRLKLKYWLDKLAEQLPSIFLGVAKLRLLFNRTGAFGRFELGIHLQSPVLSHVGRARRTWLVPNQEWFRTAWLAYLPLYDNIMCKTREAENIFGRLHQNVRFVGFSGLYVENLSLPMSPETVPFEFFLHVAGRNLRKGTEDLVELWRRHPEWPVLKIVVDYLERLGILPANIEVCCGIPTDILSLWQRTAIAVVAPSRVEGFGHSILEPLARGGLVITTDAPPMNELVDGSRGILVAATRTERVLMGQSYRVNLLALEAAVYQAIGMSPDEQKTIRETATRWAQSNHQLLIKNWTEAIGPARGVIRDKS